MKISINRNFIWSQVFVEQLSRLGIEFVCISPGSRSAPLTQAFGENKKIKSFVIPDERSSCFFALGLAKVSHSPVAVVTTSGTAVAELYPAIIEAYQQRIPIIICTADRPAELRNSGANQTINQHNIFKNHIRYFEDLGLPRLNMSGFAKIKKITTHAVKICSKLNKGPVHLNFPFGKPLEKNSNTDEVEKSFLDKIQSDNFFLHNSIKDKKNYRNISVIRTITDRFKKIDKGIIICSGGIEDNNFQTICVKFAKSLGYPILADGTGNIRFEKSQDDCIITNYSAFISSWSFQKKYDPGVIIQFGKTPTSNQLLDFFKNSQAEKFLINKYGDLQDPSRTTDVILAYDPAEFCIEVMNQLKSSHFKIRNDWGKKFSTFDSVAANIKKEKIEKADFPFEGRIVTELISLLPYKSNLVISNSLPIRDFDYFVPATNKKVNIFTNRGASGIDGITSTALGIASQSEYPTVLLTGDLAFYHDMNGLLAAMKYSIPLTIVLINNNGGGIFETLPISKEKEVLETYFTTPHNLDFAHFVISYNGFYTNILNWERFGDQFHKALKREKFSVLEIVTDARKSATLRKEYFSEVHKSIEKHLNES